MSDELLPFAQLWPTLAAAVAPLPTEQVELADAHLRVLAAPGRAVCCLPGADTSAMDGYAVRSADTAVDGGSWLELAAGDAYAGSRPTAGVGAGQALPIATGGVIPPGADAVAVKEVVTREGSGIRVRERVAAGAWVRRQGEDVAAGDLVVATGERLDAGRLVALAAAGVTRVTVGRRPRVAVVATGTELVPLGTLPAPGQVVNTNGPFLAWQVERFLGVAPVHRAHAVDEPARHLAVLATALAQSDVVLLTGGVSVGDRDLVKGVLEQRLGVERVLWRVAQKPGKPLYVGRRQVADGTAQWVVGLPGNPAAVVVGFWLVVRPLLLALMGASAPETRRAPVRLAAATVGDRARTTHLACRGEWRAGELWAVPVGRTGSQLLSGLASADLLVSLPPGESQLAVGARLEAAVISL